MISFDNEIAEDNEGKLMMRMEKMKGSWWQGWRRWHRGVDDENEDDDKKEDNGDSNFIFNLKMMKMEDKKDDDNPWVSIFKFSFSFLIHLT